MKNIYIAVGIEENNRSCAYIIKVTTSDNILSKLALKGVKYANICETKKTARETVEAWNNGYKNNGTYAFT